MTFLRISPSKSTPQTDRSHQFTRGMETIWNGEGQLSGAAYSAAFLYQVKLLELAQLTEWIVVTQD